MKPREGVGRVISHIHFTQPGEDKERLVVGKPGFSSILENGMVYFI